MIDPAPRRLTHLRREAQRGGVRGSACWAAFFQELIIFKEKEPVSIHIKRDKLFPAPRLFF